VGGGEPKGKLRKIGGKSVKNRLENSYKYTQTGCSYAFLPFFWPEVSAPVSLSIVSLLYSICNLRFVFPYLPGIFLRLAVQVNISFGFNSVLRLVRKSNLSWKLF